MRKENLAVLGEWVVAGLAAVMFYVILVTSNALYNGLVMAKYFTFLSCLVVFSVAVAVWAVGSLRRKENSYRITWIDGAVGIFIGYYLFNTLGWGAANPRQVVLSVGMGIWYAGLRILFTSERIFRILTGILLLCAGYEAILGLLQHGGWMLSNHGLYTVTGTFFNPGPYGGFLAMFVPIALYGMIRREKSRVGMVCRWLAGGGFFFGLVLLPITWSRMAWLAAFTGCLAVLGERYGAALKTVIIEHRRVIICLTVIAVVGFVVGGIGMWRLKAASAEGRWLIWKIATRMIGDDPVTGCGFGRFAGGYGECQAEYFTDPRLAAEVLVAGAPQYAFNEYVQILVEGGAIGFVGFMTMAGLGLWGLWRRRKTTGGLFFGTVGLAVFAGGSYPFALTEFLLVGMFLLAVAAPAAAGIRVHRYGVAGCWIVLVLTWTIFILLAERPRKEAYEEWRTDRMMYDMKLYGQVVRSAKLLFPYLKTEPEFLFEYGHSLHFVGDYKNSNDVLMQGVLLSADPMFWNVMGNNHKMLGNFLQAEKCYLRAVHGVPNRIYPLYLLTKLYRETGQKAKMRLLGNDILNFREKIVSPACVEIKREVAQWMNEP
ncbi:O-antigen ligase family protein [uncultured Rikenella sp.]|uniref:O-antigen ligase family protein n=1 Tax=uncultured Rikenella sp. TaxID=368003 RepID=UPI0025D86199|nr:O-antigen ligase family protein [uncultured Rikenella sp.]